MFFFFGATNPGKSTVGYVYLIELVPNKFQNYIGTLMLFGDGFTTIFICLYFRFVTNQWLYFQIVGISMVGLSTLAILMLPESPKYLESKKLYSQAKTELMKIARYNRKLNYSTKFVFENEALTDSSLRKSISMVVNS